MDEMLYELPSSLARPTVWRTVGSRQSRRWINTADPLRRHIPALEDQLYGSTSDFNRGRACYSPDRVDALVG